MRKFSVTLYGQTMEESVRKKAEEHFAVALDAGVAHFEDCKSAWQALCKMAMQAVESNLDWRLSSEGYHFDVTFY